LKPKKCELFQKEMEFLGTVVGPRRMHIGPGYIKDIEDWPRPKNKKEVERRTNGLPDKWAVGLSDPPLNATALSSRTVFESIQPPQNPLVRQPISPTCQFVTVRD
jgi:hypothetical protein